MLPVAPKQVAKDFFEAYAVIRADGIRSGVER
jgi:hypothetical protein